MPEQSHGWMTEVSTVRSAAEVLAELVELHAPATFTSAPYSRDGVNDDLCCVTCIGSGSYRNTGGGDPSWP